MPSRIDEAGHTITKAFDYPVAEHWGGKSKNETVPGGIRTHKCSHLFRNIKDWWRESAGLCEADHVQVLFTLFSKIPLVYVSSSLQMPLQK